METLDVEVLLGILVFLANTYLGVLVFLRNTKSWTNRFFLLLALLIDAYVITNFYSLHPGTHDQLTLIRIVMFVTSLIGPTLLFLVHTFPGTELKMKRRYVIPLLLLMITSATLSLLPYVFTDLQYVNGAPVPTPGPAIPIFFADFVGLFIASFIVLGVKFKNAIGIERDQLRTILYGVTFSFSLMSISTVILVVILKTSTFVFLGPIYTMFLLGAIAYAIMKYNLFNMKTIATQAFVIIISIVFFARIFVSQTLGDRVVDIIIFCATAFFGYLLIRSVKDEIRSKDEIAKLAQRLTESNWELARTNEQLRIIDQRKSEFVSIVSHQLRTPITALKGYASLLLEESYGKLSESQRAPVVKIFISAQRLASMVSDFLDISKIEQGTMTYVFSSVDIGTMLSDLQKEFLKDAAVKDLTLEFADPGPGVFVVFADEGKIRQCFSNIIDNAIKYTPKGGISISLEKDEEKGTIVCRIKDTGIGLSQEDIHHLFGKFTRGTEGQRHNTEGSGIGLYVAKKMIEAQHGNIWIDSEGPGKGSTFVIELSIEVETAEVPEEKLSK